VKKTHTLSLLGLAAMLVAACAPHAHTTSDAPIPDKEMARLSGRSLSQLQRGHAIYMKQCSQCHTPMMPDEVTEGDWHIVVPGMAWNAGIDREDEEAVLQYVIAAREIPSKH